MIGSCTLVFQVVVAVEKDSAMAPKKVDYAVLHSTVGWPNSKCGFTKIFTKCMFFSIKWSSLPSFDSSSLHAWFYACRTFAIFERK